MTVKELIEALQKLPPEMNVRAWEDGIQGQFDIEMLYVYDGELWL